MSLLCFFPVNFLNVVVFVNIAKVVVAAVVGGSWQLLLLVVVPDRSP